MRGLTKDRRLTARLALALWLAAVLLLPLAPTASAEHLGYAVYDGGAHPVTLTSSTWTMYDIVYGGVMPGAGGSVSYLDLHGIITGPKHECLTWRGLSSDSGTLIVQPSGRTYTLYDAVVDVNVYSATTMTMTGKWVDQDGDRGVFGAVGYIDYVIDYDCGIFFDGWAFGQSNTDPQDIIDYLDSQLPDNQAPNAPSLVGPSNGYTFQPDQLQLFSVQASDPDGDVYFGQIHVKRPLAPDFDPAWQTAVAQSSEVATGAPPVPYGAGSGYEWKATAWDGRLISSMSAQTRTFSVAN